MKVKIGSMFCGTGGMDTGLHNIGFETIWAIDIMKDACKTFKLNYPNTNVINRDVHEIEDFNALGKVNGLVFGPPCQGFSVANKNRHQNFEVDKRNYAYLATLKALKDTHADFLYLKM